MGPIEVQAVVLQAHVVSPAEWRVRQRRGIGTLGTTLSPILRTGHRSAADGQFSAANTGTSAGKASPSGNLDGSTVSGIDGAVADANA